MPYQFDVEKDRDSGLCNREESILASKFSPGFYIVLLFQQESCDSKDLF